MTSTRSPGPAQPPRRGPAVTFRGRVGLVAVGVIACMGMSPMTVARAHSGNAVFETLQAEGGSDLVIHVRLRVRYSEDRELAERAFLKATPTSPDGRTLPEVDLERETSGVYRGAITVDQPGTWTLAIASAFPPGNTTLTVDVGDEGDKTKSSSQSDGDGQWFAVIGVSGAMGVLGLLVISVRRRRR